MTLTTGTNSLDALNGTYSIWDQDPLHHYVDADGKYDPIYSWRESKDYPGYYEYKWVPYGEPEYIYERMYKNGRYIMKPIKQID